MCFGFAPQTLGNYYPTDPKLFKDLQGWHVVHPVEKQQIGHDITGTILCINCHGNPGG